MAFSENMPAAQSARPARRLAVGLGVSLMALAVATPLAAQETVPSISVNAPATTPTPAAAAPVVNSDGSTKASGGLYVEKQSFGPFGDLNPKNIPFSTNSIPQTVILDQQALTLSDALRNDPSYYDYIPPGVAGYSNFVIRGFVTDYPINNRIDGLPLTSQTGLLLNDYERIDLLKGLTGLQYGFSAPGGIVNYVSKLPLDKSYTSITAGYASDAQFSTSVDMSRRFGPYDQFGIRINVGGAIGDAPITDMKNNNFIGALALDWKPVDTTKFWLNTFYSRDAYQGLQPLYYTGTSFTAPKAPSPDNFLGVPFSQHIGTETGLEAGVQSDITPWLSGHATVGDFYGTRNVRGIFAAATDNLGNFQGETDPNNIWAIHDSSAEVMLSPHFTIGQVTSKTDFGFTIYQESESEYNNIQGVTLSGISNIYDPLSYANPNTPVSADPSPYSGTTNYSNFVLQETLDFTKYLTVIGGVARGNVNYSDNGGAADSYNQSAVTPTVAVIVKPIEQLSLYASYIEGLSAGTQASDTYGTGSVVNANAYLPPFVEKQYEIGAKYQVTPGLQLNAAAFRISEPSAIYAPTSAAATSYIYEADGNQVNKGIELSAVGQATSDLKIFGGLMLLDARIENAQDATLNGKHAVGVPNFEGSLFAEYALPWVHGLSALGGVRVLGQEYYDNANMHALPAVATVDLGLKYQTVINKTNVTARLYVKNVANTGYWQALSYAGLLYLGDPRTVRASVTATF